LERSKLLEKSLQHCALESRFRHRAMRSRSRFKDLKRNSIVGESVVEFPTNCVTHVGSQIKSVGKCIVENLFQEAGFLQLLT